MTLLTAEETAKYLKVAKQTLYKWNSMGILPGFRLGGLKFVKEDIDRIIEARRKNK